MHILVVEDDRPLARILRKSIESSGHTVDIVGDGADGLALGAESGRLRRRGPRRPAAAGSTGFEVRRRLRDQRVRTPVPKFMLTARDTWPDRVAGLDAGADDYLTKPFALEELLARVRALNRRANGERGDDEALLPWAT